jgi:hypothetical protein
VFHAGHNQAYVSLDPSADPTRVAVNFGGLLEDTRVGSVVLQADKRFKTITSGIDPDTHEDLRGHTRRYVPTFASCSEREILDHEVAGSGWIGTRFWYYPDSVEVDADFDYRYAVVRRAQFTADAERSRDDFADAAEFERLKKARLSPAIRNNIDHLNSNYPQYANAFPELRELSTVARLMAVCVWLQRAEAGKSLDLDALLQVELPAWKTPRDRTQLLAAGAIVSGADTRSLAAIQTKLAVKSFTPLLDRPVNEAFSTEEEFARYVSLVNGREADEFTGYMEQARRALRDHKGQPLRAIIRSEPELKALLACLSGRIDVQLPEEWTRLEVAIKTHEAKVQRLDETLDALSAVMERSVESHNANVDRYNQLVEEHRKATNDLNTAIEKLKSRAAEPLMVQTILEMGGGIDLGPKEYALKRGADSPELRRLKKLADATGNGVLSADGETWLRSDAGGPAVQPKPTFVGQQWDARQLSAENGETLSRASSKNGQYYWLLRDKGTQNWRDQWDQGGGRARLRFYDAKKRELQVADFQNGKQQSLIAGEFTGANRIVFRPSDRTDLLPPKTPPHWWNERR